MAFFQLLFNCIVGTFISHQHEKIMNILWNFKWHKLPKSEQKSFLKVLRMKKRIRNSVDSDFSQASTRRARLIIALTL